MSVLVTRGNMLACWIHVRFLFFFGNVNFCGLGLARQHDFTPLYRRWRANWRPERFPCVSSVQIRMPSYLRAPQTSAIATPLRASFLAFAWTPLDAFGYLWHMIFVLPCLKWSMTRLDVLQVKHIAHIFIASSCQIHDLFFGDFCRWGSEVFERPQRDGVFVLPLWWTGFWPEWSASQPLTGLDQSVHVGQHRGGWRQVGILQRLDAMGIAAWINGQWINLPTYHKKMNTTSNSNQIPVIFSCCFFWNPGVPGWSDPFLHHVELGLKLGVL